MFTLLNQLGPKEQIQALYEKFSSLHDIAMRTFLTSILVFVATVFENCSTSKNYGHYVGNSISIHLSKDNRFTYKYFGHVGSDTSAGVFTLVNDTIFMRYYLNNYDSILQATQLNNEAPRLDIMLGSRYWKLRPQRMVWHKRKIYFTNNKTGEVIRNEYLKLRDRQE